MALSPVTRQYGVEFHVEPRVHLLACLTVTFVVSDDNVGCPPRVTPTSTIIRITSKNSLPYLHFFYKDCF